MIALLPAYLTKAYVRGHLRTLAGGRAIQVNPYHTKTAAASREDTRTRDIFADIPPAENQHRPRIHPARTNTPRKAVVPFQAVYPQLFDDKPLASDQNVHYNKDIKGRNPAPANEGKKMDEQKGQATSTPRLMAAADFLEKTLTAELEAEGEPTTEDDKADFVLVKEAIQKLRTTDRKDLDAANWAGVLYVLKVKNALHIASLLEESEGKKFSAAPKAGRIYLSVPYADKDKAKATADKAGTRIRFDGDKKKWYWEGEGELPGALAKWAPEGAKPQGSGEPAMDDERNKLVALFDGDHAKADAEQQVHIEIIKAAVMRTQPKAGKDLWETAKKEFGPREKNAYAHYMEFKRLQASAGQTPIRASDREIYENAHGQWAAEKKYGRRE